MINRHELERLRDDRTCLRAVLMASQAWIRAKSQTKPKDEATQKLLAAINGVLADTD